MNRLLVPAVLLPLVFCQQSYASCDSCYLPRVERDNAYSLGADRKGFFVDFRYEYQDWDTQSVVGDDDGGHDDGGQRGEGTEHMEEAGHSGEEHGDESEVPILINEDSHSDSHAENGHLHNRSHENIYHMTLGANVSDALTLVAHLPYVTRNELTARGSEESKGFSDTNLLATWRFLRNEQGFLGLIGGVKLPTGTTSQKDSTGERFEPELQPGSGSTDVTLGLAWQRNLEPVIVRGNVLQILRTEGDQDYQFGNTTSASLFADMPISERANYLWYAGVDSNFQFGEKDEQDGRTISDSGATLVFLGPSVTLRANNAFLLSGSALYPVVQDRGGDHQDLASVYTVSLRALF